MIEVSDEYDSRQDYLHQQVLNDIRDVELENPRNELKDIRRRKESLRDEIDEVVTEIGEMRDHLGELEERESELQAIVDDYGVTSAKSYDALVREAAEEIIREDLTVSEGWERIQRISEKWQEDPMDVLRDIYEYDPRIDAQTAKPYGKPGVPDEWQTRIGDTWEEAVRLVRHYCEARKDSGYYEGIYVEDEYVSRVAEEYGEDCEKILRDAVEDMDETFSEIIYRG